MYIHLQGEHVLVMLTQMVGTSIYYLFSVLEIGILIFLPPKLGLVVQLSCPGLQNL